MVVNDKLRIMLEEQREEENLCVKKYKEFANKANDQALKDMFNEHATAEQQHYDTLGQILNGVMPQMGQEQNQGNQENQSQQQHQHQFTKGKFDENDYKLCSDLLVTEKYVSDKYNDAIFDSIDTDIRSILNHIQKEEQEHGEHILQYMEAHDMHKIR